jgi:cytochrome c peroxidase
MTTRTTPRWCIPLCLALAAPSASAGEPGLPAEPQVPVALAWGPDRLLRVALRDALQVVTVDARRGAVVVRRDLPFRPASLAYLDDRTTLVVGGMDGEVLAVGPDRETVLCRASGRGPARVVAIGGGRVAAAARWEPLIRIIDVSDGRVVRSWRVPFAPGAMIRRHDGRLIVADAFGSQLVDLDPDSGRVSARVLDGVNLRALALSADGRELLVGHMSQYDAVPVTEGNIDAGLVMSSRLSAVRLTAFDGDDPARSGTVVERRRVVLDGPRHGAADPSALAVSPDGGVVMIALSGAHQVIKNDRRISAVLGDPADLLPLGHNLKLETLEVGRSPLDIVFDPSGESAITADSMSDTLTVVRVSDLTVTTSIPLGRGMKARTAAQRGEADFLDGRRALDRWMSCATCHAGGHTNGLNFDTLGDGGYGASKNTPSLLGVGPTAPFAWAGRFATLSAQVHQSLLTSLRGPSAEDALVEDLTAYLQSLRPPPPRRSRDDPAARRGSLVFDHRRCQTCHAPPHYTTEGVKSVGLDDGAGGHRAFNAPSLLGVGWTAPYFHDGRASTLEDVLKTHPPGPKTPLGPDELSDLKAFLESL